MMSKKQLWLIAILMRASTIAGGITSSRLSLISQVEAQRNTNVPKTTARRYQYQSHIAVDPKDLADQANKFNDGGWVLTEVITDERVMTRYIGFFRREKR